MTELSIRLTHISQSLVSMTKKILIISRKELLLKFPNQVRRGDLVSVRTCNLLTLPIPIPVFTFEYHTDTDFAKNTD